MRRRGGKGGAVEGGFFGVDLLMKPLIYTRARQRMIEQQLKARGIRDPRVLAAMADVPRERFVDPAFASQAYGDSPLPIGERQTISQPYTVALMLEALELEGPETVLEVGTGTGYQAAVLSKLVARVYTIERHLALSVRARSLLEELGCMNVVGTLGWREHAPFDAIVVAAGGPSAPPTLLDQLSEGGRLVMPLGEMERQELYRFRKTASGVDAESLGGVRFVPLIGRFGWDRSRTET